MRAAIDETNRRRAKQVAYNTERGLDPQPIRKKIADITDLISREDADTKELLAGSGRGLSRGVGPKAPAADVGRHAGALASMPAADLTDLIEQLTAAMHTAAEELQFEVAARYRDEIAELKKELRGMQDASS
jgi:excinuclease ABC subunit B